MADLMGEGESQPVFLASVLIDVLINTNALKVLGQKTVDIDLLEQTEDRDGSKPQIESTISMIGTGRSSDGMTCAVLNSSAFSRTCGHDSRGGLM